MLHIVVMPNHTATMQAGMNNSIKIRLAVFAVGAAILAIGDYLYGTTYYTNVPTTNEDRFLVSGILGYVTAICYLYGIFGYAKGFLDPNGLLRKLTLGGLGVFTIGVAVTHSIANAHMYVFNARLLDPGNATLEAVFLSIDNAYNLFFIGAIAGLLVGYISLLIGIVRKKTVFSRTALIFFPFNIVLVISLLDSAFEGYPILLKSAAWSGVVFNLALILFDRTKTKAQT